MRFGERLKGARKQSQKILKELSTYTGLSLSYLSDLEHGRGGIPDLGIVRRMEDFLGITDESLVSAAKAERKFKRDAKDLFSRRPEMNLALLRAASDLSEEDVNNWIREMSEKNKTKKGD